MELTLGENVDESQVIAEAITIDSSSGWSGTDPGTDWEGEFVDVGVEIGHKTPRWSRVPKNKPQRRTIIYKTLAERLIKDIEQVIAPRKVNLVVNLGQRSPLNDNRGGAPNFYRWRTRNGYILPQKPLSEFRIHESNLCNAALDSGDLWVENTIDGDASAVLAGGGHDPVCLQSTIPRNEIVQKTEKLLGASKPRIEYNLMIDAVYGILKNIIFSLVREFPQLDGIWKIGPIITGDGHFRDGKGGLPGHRWQFSQSYPSFPSEVVKSSIRKWSMKELKDFIKAVRLQHLSLVRDPGVMIPTQLPVFHQNFVSRANRGFVNSRGKSEKTAKVQFVAGKQLGTVTLPNEMLQGLKHIEAEGDTIDSEYSDIVELPDDFTFEDNDGAVDDYGTESRSDEISTHRPEPDLEISSRSMIRTMNESLTFDRGAPSVVTGTSKPNDRPSILDTLQETSMFPAEKQIMTEADSSRVQKTIEPVKSFTSISEPGNHIAQMSRQIGEAWQRTALVEEMLVLREREIVQLKEQLQNRENRIADLMIDLRTAESVVEEAQVKAAVIAKDMSQTHNAHRRGFHKSNLLVPAQKRQAHYFGKFEKAGENQGPEISSAEWESKLGVAYSGEISLEFGEEKSGRLMRRSDASQCSFASESLRLSNNTRNTNKTGRLDAASRLEDTPHKHTGLNSSTNINSHGQSLENDTEEELWHDKVISSPQRHLAQRRMSSASWETDQEHPRLATKTTENGVAQLNPGRKALDNPAKIPPRPPNAFILYRIDNHDEIKRSSPDMMSKDISKLAGTLWRNESLEIRGKYFAWANRLRMEHTQKYGKSPYGPRKNKKVGGSVSKAVPSSQDFTNSTLGSRTPVLQKRKKLSSAAFYQSRHGVQDSSIPTAKRRRFNFPGKFENQHSFI